MSPFTPQKQFSHRYAQMDTDAAAPQKAEESRRKQRLITGMK